jgi:hypothetical protein
MEKEDIRAAVVTNKSSSGESPTKKGKAPRKGGQRQEKEPCGY